MLVRTLERATRSLRGSPEDHDGALDGIAVLIGDGDRERDVEASADDRRRA
jgi:hypothetical protein